MNDYFDSNVVLPVYTAQSLPRSYILIINSYNFDDSSEEVGLSMH